jgi:hypothetical protein
VKCPDIPGVAPNFALTLPEAEKILTIFRKPALPRKFVANPPISFFLMLALLRRASF